METVSILQGGHERGISSLGFSGDGKVGPVPLQQHGMKIRIFWFYFLIFYCSTFLCFLSFLFIYY